jgi:hypothetical protein
MVARDLIVLVQRDVLGPTRALCVQNSFDGFPLQPLQRLALTVLRHGQRFYSGAKSAQRYFGTTKFGTPSEHVSAKDLLQRAQGIKREHGELDR